MVDADKRAKAKLVAALIGGSAVVAMGAVTMALHDEHTGTTTVVGSKMTMGETTTMTAPPTVPETSIAVPVVKANPYGG